MVPVFIDPPLIERLAVPKVVTILILAPSIAADEDDAPSPFSKRKVRCDSQGAAVEEKPILVWPVNRAKEIHVRPAVR